MGIISDFQSNQESQTIFSYWKRCTGHKWVRVRDRMKMKFQHTSQTETPSTLLYDYKTSETEAWRRLSIKTAKNT